LEDKALLPPVEGKIPTTVLGGEEDEPERENRRLRNGLNPGGGGKSGLCKSGFCEPA
jgi:hypothetical protein